MEHVIVYKKEDLPFQNGYFYQFVQNRALTKIEHSHDFYELAFVLRGKAIQRVDGEKISMREGDVCILSTRNAHYFESQSKDLSVFSLSVEATVFQRLQNSVGFIPLCGQSFQAIDENLRNYIEKLPQIEASRRETWLNALLAHLFFVFVQRDYPQLDGIPTGLQHAVTKLRETEHLASGIPAFMALSGYSRVHLCRLTAKYYGKTPFEILQETRMQVAEEYLKTTALSIEEIAYKIGFSSVSRFHSLFKARHGITPAQFRRNSTSKVFSI